MAGIFAGLGRSGKKKEEAKAAGDELNTAGPASKAPKSNTDTNPQSTGNTEPTLNINDHNHTDSDRSKNMRLSKGSSSKPEEDFDIPSDTVIPSFASSVTKSNTSEVRHTTPTAVIGPKIRFKGELTGEEDLLIEGYVEGTIELKNNHLTIGKQGSVKADVVAKSISIEGSVEGDLVAEERIAINASSNVSGNVTADRVTLEDGAKFRGSIDMDTKNSTGKTAPKFAEKS